MHIPGMRLRIPLLLAAAILPLTLATGCQKAPPGPADSLKAQGHHHHPPHGGTPVVLGDEEYHLELVLDRGAGKLQAYVLDDEMEDFVRVSAPSIAITATAGGQPRDLVLAAVPNPVTGETVGDTSLFEAQADWLRTVPQFDGVLRSITIRGATFTGVRFNFPKGNDTDG
jgi:hypothetical protein